MRYKIRKELNRAFVFDRIKRKVITLTKEEFQELDDFKRGKVHRLPEYLQKKGFLEDGRANFCIIENPYKLGDFLSAPNRIYLELTRKCQLKCRMCYNSAGSALSDEMTDSEIKNILKEMDKAGIFEARFTGGEPTEREDFFEILDYAIGKDLYVSLATNGVWNKELTQEICRRKIDDVIVSLDGPEKINDMFREGGSFKKTFYSIKELKKSGIKKVRINTVLSKLNFRKVEPLFKICADYDLLLIDFIHPRPFGRASKKRVKELFLSAEEVKEFNIRVKNLRKKYPMVKVVMDFDLLSEDKPSRHPIVSRIKACPAGREFAFISPQGYLFPCSVAPVKDVNLMTSKEKDLFFAGNVLESKLLDLWHFSAVWENFRDLKKCKPKKCFQCKFWGRTCFGTCPIGAYYETGALNGEDSYCYSHLI